MIRRCLVAAVLLATVPAARADEKAPQWVAAMKKVHEQFTGTPGTLALFGDSITTSMAFWAPVAGELKGRDQATATALVFVKGRLRKECYRDWRGGDFGNTGSTTVRWADENVGKWLKKLNPEAAVIMFGTNDLTQVPADEYEKKLAAVVDRCLENGTVVILTTPPPRSGLVKKSEQFAEAVRRVAGEKKVPLIDYHAEILKRRPDDWDGSLKQFKDAPGDEYQVPTLIARDGVHPSNPSKYQEWTAEGLRSNGYLLRNYLTLHAYHDVVRHVLAKEGPRKKERGEEEVRRLERRVAGLKPEEVKQFREEVRDMIRRSEWRQHSFRLLDVLLKLPREGEKPERPKFPFTAEQASGYQALYARWLGVPASFGTGQHTRFSLVPPGTFLIGSPRSEPGRGSGSTDETQCEVTLTRPFYLCTYETSVGEFAAFVAATKHETDAEQNGGGHAHDARAVWEHRKGLSWRNPGFPGQYTQGKSHPVVQVSHNDAVAFCRWLQGEAKLSEKSPLAFGLPTEAQWEWACRAGSGARYWWGDREDRTGGRANVGDKVLRRTLDYWPRKVSAADDGHGFVAPVTSYNGNGFGLHNMLGNVWEMCSTRVGRYPRDRVTDPGDFGPRWGFAVRGGGWSDEADVYRCATRDSVAPKVTNSNLGFRVAIQISLP